LPDDRCGSTAGQKIPKGLAVVGRVRQQGFRRLQRFDQTRRWLDAVTIAAGQFEGDNPALSVNDAWIFVVRPPRLLPMACS
jgi:hypothetical protein